MATPGEPGGCRCGYCRPRPSSLPLPPRLQAVRCMAVVGKSNYLSLMEPSALGPCSCTADLWLLWCLQNLEVNSR